MSLSYSMPDANLPRLRIAFDCPGALTLLEPQRNGTAARGGIGGAEVRAFTFAKWLAGVAGHDVAFVVGSEEYLPAYRQRDGLEIRFEPRREIAAWKNGSAVWTQLCIATRKISRSVVKQVTGLPESRPFYFTFPWDVMVAMGVTNRTATLVRTARQLQLPCIVCLTTDRTLDDFRRQHRKDRGIYGEQGHRVRYALRHARAVVAQTKYQQAALQRLGIASTWIPNPIDLDEQRPREQEATTRAAVSPYDTLGTFDELNSNPPVARSTTVRRSLPAGPFVLWVGRADTFSKRADLAIEAARRCHNWPMVLIMNRHDDACYQQLTKHLPTNIHLLEYVDFDRIEHVYQQAAILLNTSVAEGFPNSFLQAGKHGVPVISHRVDPDQMLTKQQAGICCHGDFAAMCDTIDLWMSCPAHRAEYSRRIRDYVHTHHNLQRCASSLGQLIQSVWQGDGLLQQRQIA